MDNGQQEKRSLEGVVGAVFILLGLVCCGFWLFYVKAVLQGALPVLLIGFGAWMVFRAMGVSVREVWGRLLQSWQEMALRGASTMAVLSLRCPNCGSTMPEGTKFCLQCGNILPQPKVCPQCQKLNLPEANFCGHCGAKLTEG